MKRGLYGGLLAAVCLLVACPQEDDDDACDDDITDDDDAGDDTSGDDDTAPPPLFTVASTTPANNAVAVAADATFEVVFTDDVDPETLTADTVVLHAHQRGYLGHSLDYNDTSRTLTVTPDRELHAGDLVRLTLTPGLLSTSGDPLELTVMGDPVHSGYTLSSWAATTLVGSTIEPTPSWTSDEADVTVTGCLVDLNRDGWLDAIFANGETGTGGHSRAHLNDGAGTLATTADWSSDILTADFGCAVADIDRDGWNDAAFGQRDGENYVHLNDGEGMLGDQASWRATSTWETRSLAFGDMDNDGWLDLAIANTNSVQQDGFNEVHRNLGGALDHDASWQSADSRFTRSVVWADLNNDGFLDLSYAAMWEGQVVYYNRGGSFPAEPDWQSDDAEQTRYIAVMDLDQDGFPEMIGANEEGHSVIYANVDGELEQTASWESDEYRLAVSVAAGDLNGDGWPDIIFGHSWEAGPEFDGTPNTNTIYFNDGGTFPTTPDWVSDNHDTTWGLDLGDLDNDGDLDILASERDLADSGVPNHVHYARP